MEGVLSSTTTTDPSDSHKPNSPHYSPTPSGIDSSPNSANHCNTSSPDPKTLDSNHQSPYPKSLDNQPSAQAPDSSIDPQNLQYAKTIDQDPEQLMEETENEENEGEGEGECGFCLFMKGGGCRDSFIAWENCIEEAEKNKEDIVEKCFQVTGALKKCMEAHPDYYEPILRAEKAAEEEATKELEREKAAGGSEVNAGSKELEQKVESKNAEEKAGSSNQ